VTRARLFDGAQRRFKAHDRRWRLIQEMQRGSNARMKDWAFAYLRWYQAAQRPRYEPPRVAPIGNMVDLLQHVPHRAND
jgi:hypothetical protein